MSTIELARPSIELDDAALHIHELTVDGSAAQAAAIALEQGRDLDTATRRMLEIGGSVLCSGGRLDLLDAVEERVERLLTGLDAHADHLGRVRDLTDTAPAKGQRFELLAGPILERCFAPFGDIVEDTTHSPGADGTSKKGDFTITVSPTPNAGPTRIVVETKDRPTLKLTGRDGALTALDGAMVNREAVVGILVCATAAPALAAQRLRSYPGNRLLVLLDRDEPDPLALELACQLARVLALQAATPESGPSAEQILHLVEQLRIVVDDAAAIRRGWLVAKRGLEAIREGYDTMRSQADAALRDLAEACSDE